MLAKAVLQLQYTETTPVEWLFPQEKATFKSLTKGTVILIPL
jgi:hypothetical protein